MSKQYVWKKSGLRNATTTALIAGLVLLLISIITGNIPFIIVMSVINACILLFILIDPNIKEEISNTYDGLSTMDRVKLVGFGLILIIGIGLIGEFDKKKNKKLQRYIGMGIIISTLLILHYDLTIYFIKLLSEYLRIIGIILLVITGTVIALEIQERE